MLMPPQQNQYDFIMNDQPKGNGPAFLQNPKQRNLIAALFVLGVLLLVVIVFAFIMSLGRGNTSSLVDVAAYQTELIRISSTGVDEATESSTKNQASTLLAYTSTDLSQLTSQIGSLNENQAVLRFTPTFDQELELAAQRNEYDKTLLEILDQINTAYLASLELAISETTSERTLIALQQALVNTESYIQN